MLSQDRGKVAILLSGMCEESCEAGELRDTLSDEAVLDGGHKSRQGSETFQ